MSAPVTVYCAVCVTAGNLYGVHFETAAERRWRLRPPLEDRARYRAQKTVGELLDNVVSGEHEAKFGWKLSKYYSYFHAHSESTRC